MFDRLPVFVHSSPSLEEGMSPLEVVEQGWLSSTDGEEERVLMVAILDEDCFVLEG